jgi:hypothetical protein
MQVLTSPRAMQWELVTAVTVLALLSRTSGAVGEFLRAFSSFLFR